MVVPKKYNSKINESLSKKKKFAILIGFFMLLFGALPLVGIDLYEKTLWSNISAGIGALLFLFGIYRESAIDEGNVIHLDDKK